MRPSTRAQRRLLSLALRACQQASLGGGPQPAQAERAGRGVAIAAPLARCMPDGRCALPEASAVAHQALHQSRTPSWSLRAPSVGWGRRGFSSYPPHTELSMPALSPTMSQGNLARWSVREGQEVAAGDILAEVETDKATLPWENQDEGFVAKLLVEDGARDVPVGTPLLVLVEEKGDVARFADYSPSSAEPPPPSPAPAASAPAAESHEEAGPSAAPEGGGERFEVSDRVGPAAAMLLREHGLRASAVRPSGPRGIVTKGDVLAAVKAPPADGKAGKRPAPSEPPRPESRAAPAAPKQDQRRPSAPAAEPPGDAEPRRRRRGAGERYTDIPNSQIRKIIAQRLQESKQQVPAVYARRNAPLGTVNSLRALFKEQGSKVSVNDFVIRAAALALAEVPGANAQWDAEAGRAVPQPSVDVSVAVATDKGLITPIVRGADAKSLAQISAEVKELAAKARANKLKPEEFQGGTFSVSNLGMYGVDRFIAIINPPQAGILAVGGPQRTVALGEGGLPREVPEVTVTLSADNRVVDEATAARFLEAFAGALANPLKLLAVPP